MELKRIIDELNYRDYPKEKTNSSIIASGKYLLSGLGSIASSYSGSPITKYNKLLREYIMMTGNFGTMTSRYVLDYNKFNDIEKQIINEEIKKKLEPVKQALDTIQTDAVKTSDGMMEQAKAINEEDAKTEETKEKTETKGGKRSKQPTKKRRNPRKGSVFKHVSKKALHPYLHQLRVPVKKANVKPKSRVRERRNVKNRTKKRVKKRRAKED